MASLFVALPVRVLPNPRRQDGPYDVALRDILSREGACSAGQAIADWPGYSMTPLRAMTARTSWSFRRLLLGGCDLLLNTYDQSSRQAVCARVGTAPADYASPDDHYPERVDYYIRRLS